jgi:hypothetical protein
MDPTVSARTELDAVRVRRAELRETLNGMERSLAAPAAGRAVVWGEAVHASLLTVASDFGAHVEVTEGPGGLHQSILAGDLRPTWTICATAPPASSAISSGTASAARI